MIITGNLILVTMDMFLAGNISYRYLKINMVTKVIVKYHKTSSYCSFQCHTIDFCH